MLFIFNTFGILQFAVLKVIEIIESNFPSYKFHVKNLAHLIFQNHILDEFGVINFIQPQSTTRWCRPSEKKKPSFQQHIPYVLCCLPYVSSAQKLNGKTKTNQAIGAWILNTKTGIHFKLAHIFDYVFFYSNFVFTNEIHFSSLVWIGFAVPKRETYFGWFNLNSKQMQGTFFAIHFPFSLSVRCQSPCENTKTWTITQMRKR